jgi:hypothetical protein
MYDLNKVSKNDIPASEDNEGGFGKLWLVKALKNFLNPECPMCGHMYSGHASTGTSPCPLQVEGSPNEVNSGNGGVYYKHTVTQCNCVLTKADIKLTLAKRAQDTITHEEREKERAAQAASYNASAEHLPMVPEGQWDGGYGSTNSSKPFTGINPSKGFHHVAFDCCPEHNAQFNGPHRVNTGTDTWGNSGYGDGV